MMKTVLGLLLVTVVTQGADSTARDLSSRAADLFNHARYAEAEPLFREALEAWGKLGPEAALQRAIDLRNLGSLLRATGRYAEAEHLLSDAAQQLEEAGAPGLETGRALYNLAALYRTRGDLAKAESFALRASAIVEKQPDISVPERLSPRLVLSSVYIEQGRFGEAEAILHPMLDSADGPLAAAAYNNLSTIALARGEFKQAESYARQALYFAHLALPKDHPAVAAAWSNLAQASRFEGRYLEAENAYRQAIGIWENALGPSHPDVARGITNLAAFFHERGREAGAEQLYARATAILEQVFGKNDARALSARNELADVLRAERRYSESARLQRTTMAALEKALPPGDPRLARAQANYARLLEETASARPCRHSASCETQTPQ